MGYFYTFSKIAPVKGLHTLEIINEIVDSGNKVLSFNAAMHERLLVIVIELEHKLNTFYRIGEDQRRKNDIELT